MGFWQEHSTQFVENYISREKGSGLPTVIRFNPWWFSGRDDLIRSFFNQLLGQLVKRNAIAKKTVSAVERLGPLIQSFVTLTKGSPDHVSASANTLRAASRAWKNLAKSNIPDLKRKISIKLGTASRKLLVVVDDIDRLSGDEVREIFRLIKSVADFPNVTYLLAFDREAVCRMLDPLQGGTGEEYLEKIVQVPFELPTPDSTALQQMMFKRLDAILAATPDDLFHKDRWRTVFTSLSRLIRTPRSVVRLTNALSLSYAPVRAEVDAVDFIAVEAVRVFFPQVYDVIRQNPQMFCEPSWRSPSLPSAEDLKKFHTNWSEALTAEGSIPNDELEPLKEILSASFPSVEKCFSHPLFGRGSGEAGAARRRICDPDAFPVYFYLSVPKTSISRVEMLALLSLSAEALTRVLISQSGEKRIDGTSRARATLEVLPNYARGLTADQSEVLTQALFRAGDQLLKADRFLGPLFPPQAWLLSNTMHRAMLNLDRAKRFGVIDEAICESTGVSAPVWLTQVLGEEHGRNGATKGKKSNPLITEEEVCHLELVALERIRSAAESGELVSAPSLLNVLSNWQRWGSNDEPGKWILNVSREPKALARMLESFLGEASVNGRPISQLGPEWVRPFVDPSTLLQAVRSLADAPWLDEKEKLAVDTFLRTHEAHEKGEDPDNLLV